jgi:ribosomal protein S18 acetylase RimI-like enzyme
MLKLLTRTDLPTVLAYLERHPLETTFLNGNLFSFGLENRTDDGRSGDYFGFYVGSELKGVIAFYNMGTCIPHYEAGTAIPEFASLLLKRQYKMLLGFRTLVDPLYQEIRCRKPFREYAESEYLTNHSCKAAICQEAVFRRASEIDSQVTAEFVLRAYQDGYGEEKNKLEVLRMFREHSGEEEFLFLISGGQIVAQAYLQTSTSKVAQIGGVYTAPEARGRGYCKAITSEFCRRITGQGKLPALIVRKDNIPAKRAYTSIGFNYYGDYVLIKC